MTGRKIDFGQKIYSFPRGGISFEDPTVPSRNTYETAFLPSLSVIPLVQQSGGRAYPTVAAGEIVKEGMLIGRGRGPGAANIHATVPGKVIRLVSWKGAGNKSLEGILIRMEGSFEKLGKHEDVFPWEGMPPYDIQRTISDYGVVEMEGMGRPVSEIISGIRSSPEPITLVVRCVFDDPWLAADYVLCNERAAMVAEGAAITARTCKVSRIIYAISHKEKELGKAFMTIGDKWGIPCSVVLVGSRYPQRNQRELEMVLKDYGKRESIDLGTMLILGPATLSAVYDAVRMHKAVLERFICVGGSAVKTPKVMKVRIGKKVGDVFDECGGFIGAPKTIASGSPLQGQPLINLDEPVIKTSYAIFAILEGFRKEKNSSCINCGECRHICPVGLDPEELYKEARLSMKKNSQKGISFGPASECHSCGCCEVVCPSRLPLSTTISSFSRGGN